MSDYRDLIEQPSTDRMDIIVYGEFTADNRLCEVVSEKEYMETEGRFNVQIDAPDSFAASLDRLGQSVDTFHAVLADEIRSYFAGIE